MPRYYSESDSWIPSASGHCDMPESDVVKSVEEAGSPMPEGGEYGINKIDKQIRNDAKMVRATMKK